MNTKNSTWIVKRKENIGLINLYEGYFSSTKHSYKDRIKLLDEITRLELQNDWINGMTQLERRQDDLSSFTVIESKINLTTNKQTDEKNLPLHSSRGEVYK